MGPVIRFSLSDEIIRSLSRHELDILKYVYENTDEIANESIQEFSKKVCYSPATVLRFCKKLGYSGFAEFKYVLRSARSSTAKRRPKADMPAYDQETSIDQINYNIQATAGLIREEQLRRTFQFLDSGASIYIWMPGGITDITAEYLEKMLFSIGRQEVYRVVSARLLTHLINTNRKDSVVFIISASGMHEPTVRISKLARMNNIPIISITPYTTNEITDASTISFRFFTDQRENVGAEYTSRLPIFFVIHTIIQCYLKYREQMLPTQQEGGRHDTSV